MTTDIQALAAGLSDKQLYWVAKLTERASAPKAEATQVGDIAPIVALIQRAKSKLKWPALIIPTSGPDNLRISIAGPASRQPGTINVTTDTKFDGSGERMGPWQNQRFGQRAWAGRITEDGVFHPGRDLSPNAVQNVTRALQAFAADPAGVAASYGHRTGHCCFCGKFLTDRVSTSLGYGPVCADNWGLPHNKATAITCEAA